MADASVATEIHEPLYVHGRFPPEVALDSIFGNGGADRIHLVFAQFPDLAVGRDTGLGTNLCCTGPPDAINDGESDNRMLAIGDVDACNSAICVFLLIRL